MMEENCRLFCSDKVVNNEECYMIGRDENNNEKYEMEETYTYHVPHKEFSSENNLDKYIDIVESYRCEECNIWFNLKSTMNMHNTIVHNGGKGFTCAVCGKCFSQKKTFELHHLTHVKEKLFKCLICSRGFKRFANMKRHSLTHTQEKNFLCEFCGKGFYSKPSLKEHYTAHNRENPYQCSLCNTLFKTVFELDMHKRVCCSETSKQTDSSMKDVMERKTLKENNTIFDTSQCKSASKQDACKTNVLKESGKIPVECQSCNKMFRMSSELKEHERIHTTEKLLKTCLEMKNNVINLLPALI